MSVRLGAIALVVALCAVSVHSQVWGYVSQSFSLVRSDILEAANYELVANISNRDAGEVTLILQLLVDRILYLTELPELRRASVPCQQMGLHCPHRPQDRKLTHPQHVCRPLPLLCRR